MSLFFCFFCTLVPPFESVHLLYSITVIDDLTEKECPEFKTKVIADALKRWGVNDLDNALLITKACIALLRPASARSQQLRSASRVAALISALPLPRLSSTHRFHSGQAALTHAAPTDRAPAPPPIEQEKVPTVVGSAANIGNLVHQPVTGLNVYDILRADKLLVEASALEHLNTWFGAQGAAWQ